MVFKLLDIVLEKEGLLHHFICPYMSEQNTIIECRYRRIVERALAMLLKASIDIEFWPYTIRTATFL